jgi:phage baseplate assembly protein W
MSGDVSLSQYERDVREAILVILETARGERVMRPRFGCGIHDLVFESIGATTLFAVEAAVREALTTFEPRIELLSVEVDPFQAMSGLLIVAIGYRIHRTNQIDNLVYPFFFKEGGQP